MQLDTEILRARIKAERGRIERQKADLEKELQQLESEDRQLLDNLQTIEAIEQLAGEMNVLEKLEDSSSFAPDRAPRSSEADDLVRRLKEWA